MRRCALIALTRADAAAARRLAAALEGAEVHLPQNLARPDEHRFQRLAPHLRTLFAAGMPLVGFCAPGILIRALAPVLADKRREPPVVAVAADHRHVVPLLGAHGGGVELARTIARALGAEPVATVRSWPPLDRPPPAFGLTLPRDPARFLRRIADGEALRIEDPLGLLPEDVGAALRPAPSAELVLELTPERRAPADHRLVWHPRVLVLGVGTSRGAPPEALIALVEETLAAAGLAPEAVACVVSLDRRMDEPAVHRLAERLGVPARFFTAAELAREAHRVPTPSTAVQQAVGIPSVAEAAALRAAGPGGRLVVAKRRNRVATCAIAQAPQPLDPETVGRARGRLWVVGLGPGDAARLTREAVAALAEASHVVGYRRYLELIRPHLAHKQLHPFDLGEELARCRRALELAAAGAPVALVCSGDPGIYAMASPLLELLEEAGEELRRVDVRIVPGISAMQAAAAAAGAPLGHDFAALSLSDLLTPRDVILARAEAAAAAGYALALYNPASSRRRQLLAEVVAILRRHRPPTTPVVVARRLGRAGERVRVVTLETLPLAEVDMETVLLVGTATSRHLTLGGRSWVVTPRGYGS